MSINESPINQPRINTPRIETPSFVIQRRIPQPLSAVHRGLADRTPLASSELLPLDPDGLLHIGEPFRPLAPFSGRQPSPSWRAPARLLTKRGRVVAAVEIEVSMWSPDTTELQLRPVTRHPERWTSRRIGRYFALAHLGADETARLLARRASTRIPLDRGADEAVPQRGNAAARRVRVWGREPLRAAEIDHSPGPPRERRVILR